MESYKVILSGSYSGEASQLFSLIQGDGVLQLSHIGREVTIQVGADKLEEDRKKALERAAGLSVEEAKKEISKELADVAGTVMVISSLLGIDLEDAINKKWITKEWIKK